MPRTLYLSDAQYTPGGSLCRLFLLTITTDMVDGCKETSAWRVAL